MFEGVAAPLWLLYLKIITKSTSEIMLTSGQHLVTEKNTVAPFLTHGVHILGIE